MLDHLFKFFRTHVFSRDDQNETPNDRFVDFIVYLLPFPPFDADSPR